MSHDLRSHGGLEALFDEWLAVTESLQSRIRAEIPQCWMWGHDHLNDTVQALCSSLSDVWYRDGQDGRVTQRHIGVAKVAPETLRGVARANALRHQFHQLLLAERKSNPALWPETSRRLAHRAAHVQEQLTDSGLVRLHIKQFSRQVPILYDEPARISFTWYQSGRSIKRLTRDDVLQRLERLGVDQPHIATQYRRVAQLPVAEELAQVQQQAPLIRANVRFQDGSRKAFNAALPVFFPVSDEADYRFPEVVQPPEEAPAGRRRARRNDQKLEDDAFVPSLRVFRYR